MRLINADELITAFPCGESIRTESVRATIKNMPTIEVGEDCISRLQVLELLNAMIAVDSTNAKVYAKVFSQIKDAPSVLPKRSCYRCGLREDCEDSTERSQTSSGDIAKI